MVNLALYAAVAGVLYVIYLGLTGDDDDWWAT
jgi:hypothetical protein